MVILPTGELFTVKTYTDFDTVITATIKVENGNIPNLFDWVLVLNPFVLFDDPSISDQLTTIAFKYITGMDGDIFDDIGTKTLENGIYYITLTSKFLVDDEDVFISCALQSITKLPAYKENEYLSKNKAII